MLTLRKVAITGGVASGKTSVCRLFQELGAFVVNADAVVHEFLVPNTLLGQQIIQQFGPGIVENGIINRKKLAKKVFTDPEKLKALEKLLHPATLSEIEKQYEKACRTPGYTAFVVEIPLLFEIEGESFYDYVIAVLADETVAEKRFRESGIESTDYDQRMKRQLPPSQKAAKADFVITNNGSFEDLKKQVVEINKIIMKQR